MELRVRGDLRRAVTYVDNILADTGLNDRRQIIGFPFIRLSRPWGYMIVSVWPQQSVNDTHPVGLTARTGIEASISRTGNPIQSTWPSTHEEFVENEMPNSISSRFEEKVVFPRILKRTMKYQKFI